MGPDVDCDCGVYKIRPNVAMCDVCEISTRYEKRLDEIEARTVAAIVAMLNQYAMQLLEKESMIPTRNYIAVRSGVLTAIEMIERGEWHKPLTGEQLAEKHGFEPHGKDPLTGGPKPKGGG